MNKLHNPKLSGNAQRLRREMTKEERHLWYDFLKTLPVTVHRQKVLGPYIVDFHIAIDYTSSDPTASGHLLLKEKACALVISETL